MVINDQINLLKKSVALTRVMPGITILLIVSEIASNYLPPLQRSYLKDSIGLAVLMVVLSAVPLYFKTGCYSVLSSGFGPPGQKLRFFNATNKYFLPLLLISFYLFVIWYIFAMCLFYLLDALAGHWLGAAKTANALAPKVVTLVTLYVIPILYTHGCRGIDSFYHAFVFLWANLGRSTVLLIIIVAEAFLWAPFAFITSDPHWSSWNILCAFIYEFISSYLDAIIFLTAVQILKDVGPIEEGG